MRSFVYDFCPVWLACIHRNIRRGWFLLGVNNFQDIANWSFMGNLFLMRVSPNFRNIMLFIMEVFSEWLSINTRQQRRRRLIYMAGKIQLSNRYDDSFSHSLPLFPYLSRIYSTHNNTHTHTQLEIKFCNIYMESGRETKEKKNKFSTFNQKTFM